MHWNDEASCVALGKGQSLLEFAHQCEKWTSLVEHVLDLVLDQHPNQSNPVQHTKEDIDSFWWKSATVKHHAGFEIVVGQKIDWLGLTCESSQSSGTRR